MPTAVPRPHVGVSSSWKRWRKKRSGASRNDFVSCKDYNIIWFTENCLSNVLRLEVFTEDAERAGAPSSRSSSARRSPRAEREPNRASSCSPRAWVARPQRSRAGDDDA
jgi:hypothetical protein